MSTEEKQRHLKRQRQQQYIFERLVTDYDGRWKNDWYEDYYVPVTCPAMSALNLDIHSDMFSTHLLEIDLVRDNSLQGRIWENSRVL